jgi:hypothetical protein
MLGRLGTPDAGRTGREIRRSVRAMQHTTGMRAVLLGAIAAAALIAVPGAQPAGSDAVASHCLKPVGEVYRDICYAVGRRRTTGAYEFILFMGDWYFKRYGLCVRPAHAKPTCKVFRVPDVPPGTISPRWGGVVSWERNYPKRGSGPYRVTWLQGGHRLGPPLTFYTRLPSYCNASLDICTGIHHAGGAWNLKLILAARYFSSYGLCVRPLGKAKRCETFPVKKTDAHWGGKVWWSHYFPRTPGRYRVTWWRGRSRIGPPLNFTLPTSA